MATKYKKISKAGGLTIPADIRRDYDFAQGDAVSIVEDDGKLIIQKYNPECFFCGAHSVKKYKGRYICPKCVAAMVKEVGTDERTDA